MFGSSKFLVSFFGLFSTCVLHSNSQQGHLKPLGIQGTVRSEVETVSLTSSGNDFYRKYVRLSRPVLYKNSASQWPAFKNWQNISYLKLTYGSNIFNIDLAKKFRQEEIAQKLMPMADYLDIYKTEDVCLESNASQSEMLKEIHLPTQLQCKELYPEMENINVVITSGDIVTPLYQAQADVLRISLSGSSSVILFDKADTKHLYHSDYILAPFASNVIPDRVDLDAFPEFSHLPYHIAELQPGDLLYIPKNWWMQATSSGDHRVGVNMWFHPFQHNSQFVNTGEANDIINATSLYDEFLDKQPVELECADRRTSLRHVLKINESDPRTLSLRIPKKNEKPDDVTLASGYKMPVLGLGTALLNENTTKSVKYALDIGYRLFDSAQGYPGSEDGIAMAMKESDVPRSDIFIVTKLHPRYLGYNSTLAAIDASLERLETDYIDLFLIHSKECDNFLLTCKEGEPEGTWKDSWKAMEHAHKLGKLRSLGVSNFYLSDLEELVSMAEIPVSVLQNWFDPIHQDGIVRKFCAQHNIRFMGYSTLGGMWLQMGIDENPILTSSLLTDLSTHYDYVVSHVVLRWAIHKNVTVIPRSASPNHIAQNLRSLDIRLSDYDIKEIDSMGSIMDDLLGEALKDGGGDDEEVPQMSARQSDSGSDAKAEVLAEPDFNGKDEARSNAAGNARDKAVESIVKGKYDTQRKGEL
eukprot:gene15359-16936_t